MVRLPRRTNIVPLVLTATLVAGCVEASVRVVQKLPAEHPSYRIYVVVHEGAVPASYARHLTRAIVEALGAHPIAREGRVLTGIEFDTHFLDEEMDRFGAHAVLTLDPIGARTGRNGEILWLIYGATLTDRPSNQPVWAAKVELNPFGVGLAASELVAALAGDHLIPPAAVSQ